MDEREPNRGDFDNVTPETLSFPTAAYYHEETGKIFVVDQGNNRVLIWNKLPSNNGVPADLVLGQKDFYSREANAGMGIKRCDASSMYFPHRRGVWAQGPFCVGLRQQPDPGLERTADRKRPARPIL